MNMKEMKTKEFIESGGAVLGIEFGSTRIKAVLIDDDFKPIATGSYSWENRFENGYFTYSEEDILSGLKVCYSRLRNDVFLKYGIMLKKLKSLGVSGMMHGYIVLDSNDKMLVPFRTWRNTTTSEAAEKLSNLFGFNIPERWSVAHLYQAILDGEEHVGSISYMTTLSGYIHYLLTGEKCVGIGEASGMFPIDSKTNGYDERMLSQFDELTALRGYSWRLKDLLPCPLSAGRNAGLLTEKGALLIDPTGELEPKVQVCPPEGDAGTGMVATNSVAQGTGNVSAGTSIFGMIVLDYPLSKPYRIIDMVTTPDGKPVAMVHCNNCTSYLNEWIDLFISFAEKTGFEGDESELYELLFCEADRAGDSSELPIIYNFVSGGPVMDLSDGVPVILGNRKEKMTLAGFMKAQINSCIASLAYGFSVFRREKVTIDEIYAHGGLFKRGNAGQRALSAALATKVSIMETAGEGGPYGMAILAKYTEMSDRVTLPQYLKEYVFVDSASKSITASQDEISGFGFFMKQYMANMNLEHIAVKNAIGGGMDNA